MRGIKTRFLLLQRRRIPRRSLHNHWYLPRRAWLPVMLLEPAPDLWPEMFLGTTAHHDPDMTSREDQILLVPAANQLQQRETGLWMDDIIMFSHHVEHWATDVLEIDTLLPNREFPLGKEIVAKDVGGDFAKNLPS